MTGVVVRATLRAQTEAQRLGITGVLENRVEEAVCSGKKKSHAPGISLGHGEQVVWLGPRVLVVVAKDGRTPSGTRWLRALRLVQTADRRSAAHRTPTPIHEGGAT
jgi:hypothetical protein